MFSKTANETGISSSDPLAKYPLYLVINYKAKYPKCASYFKFLVLTNLLVAGGNQQRSPQPLLPTAREGNVFTDVCLSTIGLIATRSLLVLVTARSVCILLECFLVPISSFRVYSSCMGN